MRQGDLGGISASDSHKPVNHLTGGKVSDNIIPGLGWRWGEGGDGEEKDSVRKIKKKGEKNEESTAQGETGDPGQVQVDLLWVLLHRNRFQAAINSLLLEISCEKKKKKDEIIIIIKS